MSEARDAAAVLWSSIDSALTLACIRTHGQREAAAVEYETQRRHHDRRLTGAQPGGAWRCAQAHLELDHDLGLRPEAIRDKAGRVWLRYRTPHWSGHGSAGPPSTPAAFGAVIGEAHFRARHGTTAAMLGGPTIAFVHTHDLTDGAPCDAGYFGTHEKRLVSADHYRKEKGHSLPAFDTAVRPTGPRAGGRSPGVSVAAWRMIVLVERLGVIGGTAVAEHALRTTITALSQWLLRHLGLDAIRTPLHAAHLYAALGALVGDEIALASHHGYTTATRSTDRLWDGHMHVPAILREAPLRAFSAALTHHEWDLRARSLDSAAPNGHITVQFDRTGPA
jgi:hypothetical protein